MSCTGANDGRWGLLMNLYQSISIAALAVVSAAAGFAQFPCSVELPVYDPEGQRLAFRVAKVWPVGVKKDGDVPRSVAGTYRVAASGTAIEFAKNWLVSNGFWATGGGWRWHWEPYWRRRTARCGMRAGPVWWRWILTGRSFPISR